MIQANELRVGNLLNYQTAEGDVISLPTDFNAIKWATEDEKGFNLVHSPIPLTEEWLVKFGFDSLYISKNGFSFIFEKIGSDFICHIEDAIILEIQYVHTLQNLCFSLTGQELTLKK